MNSDHEARIAWLESEVKKLMRRIEQLEAVIDNLRWIVRALRG